VRKYSTEPKVAQNNNAIPTAVARLRLASSRGGTSGSRLRRSMAAKAASRSRLADALTRMAGDPQPSDGPCTSANTSRVMPSVAPSAPGTSNLRPVALAVGGDQLNGEQHRDSGQRHVDEEHRLPAERLREHAAEQHADDKAGRAGAAPYRQGAVALAALGERGVDQREGGGKHKRSAEPLNGAGGEQDLRSRREPTGERGAGVERQARHEHPPRPEQVGGAATEQQETGGCHRVGADYRLQRLRRVVQLAPDLGQRPTTMY
jgi:hypothetical protein